MSGSASRKLLAVLLFFVVAGNYRAVPCTAEVVSAGAGVAKKPTKERRAVRNTVVHASWYGAEFHGRRAADGSRFDINKLTAAHRSWRLGTKLRVTNPRNGRSVVVEVTDRGPFVRGRELDLSYAAARELGMVRSGVARVHVEVLDVGEIGFIASAPIMIASNENGIGGAWPRAIVR